jgi:hypothetical protein
MEITLIVTYLNILGRTNLPVDTVSIKDASARIVGAFLTTAVNAAFWH